MAFRSTKVVFHNETSDQLTVIDGGLPWGIWSDGMAAPQTIAANATVVWQSESNGVLQGTEGRLTYRIGSDPNRIVYVHWDNPASGSNSYHQYSVPGIEVFHEGGAGNDATVDFYLRDAAPHFAPFKPSAHGFRFTNSWPSSDVEVGPLGITVPVKAMCGGMVFAALDYYYAGKVIPPNTTAPGADDPALYSYVLRRLFDTFQQPTVTAFYDYMSPLFPDTDQGLGPGRAYVMANEQLPYIRHQILAGSPVPLGLITVKSLLPTDLGENHQVLAYGYQQSGHDVTIWVYDPNTPADPTKKPDPADSVVLNFNISTNSQRIVVNHNVDVKDGNVQRPIYCFFAIPYAPSTPLPAPFSLRTYELANHLSLNKGIRGFQRGGAPITRLRELM